MLPLDKILPKTSRFMWGSRVPTITALDTLELPRDKLSHRQNGHVNVHVFYGHAMKCLIMGAVSKELTHRNLKV